MPSPPRVLLLGMDAGDRVLLRRWSAEGKLPAIGSILDRGISGDTMSLPGLYEGSTWPSFCTGAGPGRHGFTGLVRIEPGTCRFTRCLPHSGVGMPPFWLRLSEAGRRVAVLDVPLTALDGALNGIQMVEWGAHDGVYGFRTRPASLRGEVLRRYGSHPRQEPCNAFGRSRADYRELRDRLLEGVRRRAELTLHYLLEDRWDFFAQVFSEAHCIGHQCWHLHDPDHPNHDPGFLAEYGDPVLGVYQAIDRAIGRITEGLDDRTLVLFLASHRVSHSFGANPLLPEVLRRLNLTVPAADSRSPAGPSDALRRPAGFLRRQYRRLPSSWRGPLGPVLRPLRHMMGAAGAYPPPPCASGIDLNNSPCFPVPNGQPVSAVRLNLCGREPGGLLHPGPEAESFCRTLTGDLMALVDCRTGEPAVRRVIRTACFYEGERLRNLPDLLIEWNDCGPTACAGIGDGRGGPLRIHSGKTGTIEGRNPSCRTGEHRPEGLFAVVGRGVAPARLERTVSIMDFAPTITRLFGERLPGTDGAPIPEIIGTFDRSDPIQNQTMRR